MNIALSRPAEPAVSTTDFLKVLGVLALLVDHYGLFYDSAALWWRLFGRAAAPIFFFLIGFARTRSVPWTWLFWGALLTALEAATSWDEAGFEDVTFNILLNFAVLRAAILPLVERYVWPSPVPVALLAIGCVLLIGPMDRVIEYGTEGWLWALFGLAQRTALERPSAIANWSRAGVATLAAVVYIARESHDYGFDLAQAIVLAVLVLALTGLFLGFRRDALRRQLPDMIAVIFRFVGRYSLEIYAATLFLMQSFELW